MKTIRNWLERHKAHTPFFIIFIIALFVVVRSYEPGTYLSGWDTLHPEFNLRLYAERVLFGAWQEHQGLGAPASQAHAAELPRLPILFALDVLLPQSAVRHAFFYLMYLAGIAGVYVFIQDSWFEKEKERRYHWAAAFGALLYGLNLGTLQHFYVPLEMFAVHYATIGWLIWSVWKFIKTSRIKYLGWYFLFQVLSAPSAHTATLFYMYSFVVFIFIGAFAFVHHWNRKWLALKKIAVLTGTMLAAHSYWMLPNLYYIFQHSGYVQEAKISRHFSTEAFWQNQAFGAFHNVLILKNFLFNWKDYSFAEGNFVVLFDEWNKYLRSVVGYPFLYLTAVIYLAGIVIAAVKSKKRGFEKMALLVLFLLPFFFLNNLNLPSEYLFSLLQKSSSTFREALRFPFTKFSILYMLAAAVLFSEGWKTLYRLAPKLLSKQYQRTSKLLVVIATFLLIILPNYPALQGFLVSDSMKISYPEYYFEMFAWFEDQPREGRIVKLPVTDFWGWTYHDWSLLNTSQGYQGAGFLWFGLPQPIMDREFDRWVPTNEFFYHEIAHALNQNNTDSLELLFRKYGITWLVFDGTAFDPDDPDKDYSQELRSLVASTDTIAKVWESGPLQVYEFLPANESWLSSEAMVSTSTKFDFGGSDPLYPMSSYYRSSPVMSQVAYPYADLLREETNEAFHVTDSTATAERSIDSSYNQLILPAWEEYSDSIPADIWIRMTEQGEAVLTIESILPRVGFGSTIVSLSDFAETRTLSLRVPVPSVQEEYILVLNDTYIYFPHSEDSIFLGSFIIPLENSQIVFYSGKSSITYPFLRTETLFVNNCETGRQDNEAIRHKSLGNGIELNATNVVACASDGMFRQTDTPGLLAVSFSYESSTAATATRLCLFSKDTPGCLNTDPLYTFAAAERTKQAKVYQTVDRPLNFNISFNLDAKNASKEIAYSDALVEFHPQAFSFDLPLNQLQSLLPPELAVELPSGSDRITLSQGFGNESELFQGRSPFQYSHRANCGDQSGVVGFANDADKMLINAERKGIACVFYTFNQIEPSQGYALTVEAENSRGRELRLIVSDQFSAVLQEIFEPYQNIRKTALLSTDRNSTSLNAEFYGDSFGKFQSVNAIGSLSLFPFPIEWAGGVRLQKNAVISTPVLTINYARRFSNFYYLTSVDNAGSTEGVLQLSQSFDHQWQALNISHPFRKLEHVTTNNWSNGWLVPPGKHTIMLLYWPQLALFGGLAVLMTTSLVLMLLIRQNSDGWFVARGSKGYILKQKLLHLLSR